MKNLTPIWLFSAASFALPIPIEYYHTAPADVYETAQSTGNDTLEVVLTTSEWDEPLAANRQHHQCTGRSTLSTSSLDGFVHKSAHRHHHIGHHLRDAKEATTAAYATHGRLGPDLPLATHHPSRQHHRHGHLVHHHETADLHSKTTLPSPPVEQHGRGEGMTEVTGARIQADRTENHQVLAESDMHMGHSNLSHRDDSSLEHNGSYRDRFAENRLEHDAHQSGGPDSIYDDHHFVHHPDTYGHLAAYAPYHGNSLSPYDPYHLDPMHFDWDDDPADHDALYQAAKARMIDEHPDMHNLSHHGKHVAHNEHPFSHRDSLDAMHLDWQSHEAQSHPPRWE